MKKLLLYGTLAAGLLASGAAQAWTYQDGDLLLIFHGFGLNDVEYDLGSVNQFLGHPNGYTATVSGFNLSVVQGVYGSDLTGVSVALIATTSVSSSTHESWLSGIEPDTTAYSPSPSAWQNSLWSIIDSVGTRPVIYNAPTSGANAYSIDPDGTHRIASYDQIVTDNGAYATFEPELGGNAPFTVEQVIPGTLDFWQITPSSTAGVPDAYIGKFSVDTSGDLTFTAGPPQPVIQDITYQGGQSAVSFSTVIGENYSLIYTNQLGAPLSKWKTVAGPAAGTGGTVTLDYTSGDPQGFFSVTIP